MSSTAHAQRLKLRLFLEGVEVPVISANVQCAPNSPNVAAIQVPPLAEGTRLHPRTLVHLFFLDFHQVSSPFLSNRAPNQSAPNTNDPTANEPRLQDELRKYGSAPTRDAQNGLYKLLFVGEIVGFQWTKEARRRALILQCADLSNYWDYAYQWSNTGIFGPGFKAVFSGGATNLFTDYLSSKGNVITQIVTSGRCNTFPNLGGMAAGIIRLIERIGGSYTAPPGSKNRKHAGTNLFFSLAELRLHMNQMVAAVETDPTSKRIISRQGYSGMFNRALGGQGGQTSIRQAINALSKIMFHEMYGQPCPMYIPGGGGSISGVRRSSVKGDPTWGFISDNAQSMVNGLEEVKASLQDLELSLVQLQGTRINTQSALSTDKRRLQVLQKQMHQTTVEINRKTRSKNSKSPPPAARSIYTAAAQATGLARHYLIYWRAKAPSKTRNRVYTQIDEAVAQLKRAISLTFIETAVKDIYPARLVQQIFRPDIWFGAPPVCNVLFPENYTRLQYQRMFLQEPTRFLLKTNNEFYGPDILFDKFYFAPQAGTVKEDQARAISQIRRDLLDHERFTGILPIFEKMGEFNVFASRERATKTAQGMPKVTLAQRSANFLYFKHRFNSRRMQISGKFNPWIACGFPGLVIDKYADAATIALHNELRKKVSDAQPELQLSPIKIAEVLGTNFLGNFTQVEHAVSQEPEQGQTSITCSYPRQPEESTEYLGAFDKISTVRKLDDTEATRSTDIAALNPPKLYSLGPNNGRITNVQDVTPLYLNANSAEDRFVAGIDGKFLPLFDIDSTRRLRKKTPAEVPVGFPVSAVDLPWAPDVEEIIGDRSSKVIFRAYRLTESIPRYRREQALLPAEELIRPGWYGDIWSPSKIGQVYKDFFNVGSITDPQTVAGPGGAATSAKISEEAEDALAAQQDAEDADDPRMQAPGVLQLEEGASIQQAVEFLQLTYSYIKQQGIDVEEFIRAYTWRPIATMVDIFGTSDLAFDADGLNAVSGIEGFHSKAFGPYNDLYGIIAPEIQDVFGIKRGTQAAQKADTRKEKLEKVQEFASALKFSRAILG